MLAGRWASVCVVRHHDVLRVLWQTGCFLALVRLVALDLSSNLIHRLEDINVLQACVPNVVDLSLSCCPVADSKGYAQTVLGKLPKLSVLDGCAVGEAERAQAVVSTTQVTVSMIMSAALSVSGARVWPRVLGGDEPNSGASGGMDAVSDTKLAEVDSLDLSHRWIKRLSNLGGLRLLRKAWFNDNEVWAPLRALACAALV